MWKRQSHSVVCRKQNLLQQLSSYYSISVQLDNKIVVSNFNDCVC